jgi:hypothetical protein
VSLAASRLISGLLYGGANDPVTFVMVPVMLAVAVMAASYLPTPARKSLFRSQSSSPSSRSLSS